MPSVLVETQSQLMIIIIDTALLWDMLVILTNDVKSSKLHSAEPPDTLLVLKRFLGLILFVGMLGTGTELLLLGHTEGWTQLIPLIVLAVSLLSAVAVALRPSSPLVHSFRGAMCLLLTSGAVGIVMHYQGNSEFELEMHANIRGVELMWNTLTGATPALAPGTMTLLGLLGLLYSYRHPALAEEL